MANNAENQNVTTNREKYLQRLKKKYPDKQFATDDDLFGQIDDDYGVYEGEIEGYKSREKALSDLFASNPRSAAFLIDWKNGEDPIVGLIRKFGDDFKEALEDPSKQEAIAQANKEFAEQIAKEKDFEEQYQQNITQTLSTIEKMQSDRGLTDDDIDEAMEFLLSIIRDGILGKFSEESIDMALKALNYDASIQNAETEGELRGKNTKIEEKLRKRNRNDGTANLGGKNGGGDRRMPDLGAIDNGYNSQSIWERGGEKRRTYK